MSSTIPGLQRTGESHPGEPRLVGTIRIKRADRGQAIQPGDQAQSPQLEPAKYVAHAQRRPITRKVNVDDASAIAAKLASTDTYARWESLRGCSALSGPGRAELIKITCTMIRKSQRDGDAHKLAEAATEHAGKAEFIHDALMDRVENDASRVIDQFEKFKQDGLRINNFIATRVIAAYGKRNQPELAHQVLDSLGKGADSRTFGALVSIYAKAGRVEEVDKLFAKMTLLGLRVDERSVGSRVMAYAKAGLLDRAMALFDAMREEPPR
jgi:pentatricopeptide repeat protein